MFFSEIVAIHDMHGPEALPVRTPQNKANYHT